MRTFLAAVAIVAVGAGCMTDRQYVAGQITRETMLFSPFSRVSLDTSPGALELDRDTSAKLEDLLDVAAELADLLQSPTGAQAVEILTNQTNAPAAVVTPPAVDGYALAWSYGAFDGSVAVLDPGLTISNATFDSSGVYYDHSAYPRAWSGTAIACLFVVADAAAAGGKFEWAPEDRYGRTWQNVRGGYKGWVEPSDGATVLYGLWSEDGKFRSNLVRGIYRRQ